MVNEKIVDIVHNFLWTDDSNEGEALRDYFAGNKETIYKKDFVLQSFDKLLRKIIDEGAEYDSTKCIYNCSS